MTSSNWTKKTRASSKAGANAYETGGAAAPESDPAAVLRQWLLSSRGKGLLELIEAMGGKPVSLKVRASPGFCCNFTWRGKSKTRQLMNKARVPCTGGGIQGAEVLARAECALTSSWLWSGMQGAAAGKSPSGGGKVSPVQQLLAVYEAALTHLQAQGALLNSVKPEYLLPEADFTRLMEDRTAAAAGNPEEEEQLDYWAAVEASFGAYSAMAWNCVLLQVRRS